MVALEEVVRDFSSNVCGWSGDRGRRFPFQAPASCSDPATGRDELVELMTLVLDGTLDAHSREALRRGSAAKQRSNSMTASSSVLARMRGTLPGSVDHLTSALAIGMLARSSVLRQDAEVDGVAGSLERGAQLAHTVSNGVTSTTSSPEGTAFSLRT